MCSLYICPGPNTDSDSSSMLAFSSPSYLLTDFTCYQNKTPVQKFLFWLLFSEKFILTLALNMLALENCIYSNSALSTQSVNNRSYTGLFKGEKILISGEVPKFQNSLPALDPPWLYYSSYHQKSENSWIEKRCFIGRKHLVDCMCMEWMEMTERDSWMRYGNTEKGNWFYKRLN